MRPGPLLVRSLGMVTAASLLVAIDTRFVWPVLIATMVLIGIFITEAIRLRQFDIEVSRPAAVALSLGEVENVPITIGTRADRPLLVQMRQRWPRLVAQRSTRRDGLCRPGELLHFDLEVEAIRRGSEPLESATVAFTMWRFAERIVKSGPEGELSVLPNLKAVRRLHQQLNQFVLRGLGTRVAPRLGKGREFDRLRDYVNDDDYRDIAWKASARHNKLIVRAFRLDRSQEIMICIDSGHRMAARVGHLTRLDHAINATILLSYICNRMEDRIGVTSFASEVDKGIAPNRGTRHLRQITAYLTEAHPAYRYTDYLALAATLRRKLHHRALILMLTVLPEPEEQHSLRQAVELLSAQHLPLIVVMKDPNLEAAAQFAPSDRKELSRSLVARNLWEGRMTLIRELRSRGALVVESTPAEVPIAAVNAYIDVKRRQLL